MGSSSRHAQSLELGLEVRDQLRLGAQTFPSSNPRVIELAFHQSVLCCFRRGRKRVEREPRKTENISATFIGVPEQLTLNSTPASFIAARILSLPSLGTWLSCKPKTMATSPLFESSPLATRSRVSSFCPAPSVALCTSVPNQQNVASTRGSNAACRVRIAPVTRIELTRRAR